MKNMKFFFCQSFYGHELTQELAIQREKNCQFVLWVQNEAAAKDIPELFHFRSIGSFRQFKAMWLSGKPASMTMTTNRNSIRITSKPIRSNTREANKTPENLCECEMIVSSTHNSK
jgi:hypothetical protein